MEFLNYHHLYYFWTVCNEGGFTKAAQKLHLSQSAISDQVRRLEEVLGQKLINRTTRRFELSESGVLAFEYAETIFSAGKELMDIMLHGPTKGQQIIRIGALGSLSRNLQLRFLRPLLDRDDVRFQVVVGDSKRLLRMLREHLIDVVLSTFSPGEASAGNVYIHSLNESPLCAVMFNKTNTNADFFELLKTKKVFLPSRNFESRADFDHYIESNSLPLKVAGEVDDIALLRLIALSGKGIVIVPKIGILTDIEKKNLIVLFEFEKIRQKFYAITRQKKSPNPIIAELIRLAR